MRALFATEPRSSLLVLRLSLGTSAKPVEVAARVNRHEPYSSMSVEFERFAGRGEAMLIEYLQKLGAQAG